MKIKMVLMINIKYNTLNGTYTVIDKFIANIRFLYCLNIRLYNIKQAKNNKKRFHDKDLSSDHIPIQIHLR